MSKKKQRNNNRAVAGTNDSNKRLLSREAIADLLAMQEAILRLTLFHKGYEKRGFGAITAEEAAEIQDKYSISKPLSDLEAGTSEGKLGSLFSLKTHYDSFADNNVEDSLGYLLSVHFARLRCFILKCALKNPSLCASSVYDFEGQLNSNIQIAASGSDNVRKELDNLYFTNYEFGQFCGYVAGVYEAQGEKWEFNKDCFDIPVDWEQFHNLLNENSATLKERNIQELSPMAQLFLGWEHIGDPDDNGDVSMFSVRVKGSPQQIAAETSKHDLISLSLRGKSEFFIQTYRRMKHVLVSFEKMDMPLRPALPTKSDRFPFTNIDCTSAQTMSPKEKREVCALIRKDAENNKYSAFASNCTVFDFSDFTLKRVGDVFYTGDVVFEIATLGDEMTSGYGFPEFARYDMRVLVGDYKGSVRAFLEVGNAHGNPRIVELAKLNILTTFNVEGRDLAVQMVFHREDEIVDFEIFAASPRSMHPLRTDIPADAKAPHKKGFYFTA